MDPGKTVGDVLGDGAITAVDSDLPGRTTGDDEAGILNCSLLRGVVSAESALTFYSPSSLDGENVQSLALCHVTVLSLRQFAGRLGEAAHGG